MTRLVARYKNFWARGKAYQHFWASGDPNITITGVVFSRVASIIGGMAVAGGAIPGQTFARNVSLISGVATGNANATGLNVTETMFLFAGSASAGVGTSGQLITVTTSVTNGDTTQDGIAPLNTRLNARYRHFSNRYQSWKHFWASWEGAGISGTLGDGELVISPLVYLVSGQPNVDTTLAGSTITAQTSLVDGSAHGDANASGSGLIETWHLFPGSAHGDANNVGATLTAAAGLIPGINRGDQHVPGAVMLLQPSLTRGAISADGIILDGAHYVVDVSLPISGQAGVNVEAPGDVIDAVEVSIIGGVVINAPNALAIGVMLPNVNVSILPGDIRTDANIGGVVIIGGRLVVAYVSIIPGETSIVAIGQTITVTASVAIEGSASGATDVPASIRTGGPIFAETNKRKRKIVVPVHAKAEGSTVSGFAALLSGRATGEDNSKPSPSIIPDQLPLVYGADVSGASLLSELSIWAGQARGSGVAMGDRLEHKSWTKYDNEVLMLLELV